MDIIVKISTDYNNIVAQLTNPRDLRYVKELRSFNDCTFTISLKDPQATLITKYRKVQIYTIEGTTETRIWTGYISNIDNSLYDMFITCSDEKRYFMTKKILFSNKSWSGATVSTILSILTSEANGRTNQVANLKSYYKLNDDAADTTVADSHGAQTGTSQQNTENMSRDGKLDKALLFNGTADFITLTSSSNFGVVDHDFTISAFINLASLTGEKTILGHDNNVNNQTLNLCIKDGKPHLGFYGDDLTSDTVLKIGKWYHLTFVFNKATGVQSIYINGVLDKASDGHAVMTGTGVLYIGQWQTTKRMHGLIDELRIYDSVKNDDDIMELYSSFGHKHGCFTYETNLSNTLTRDYDKGTQYETILRDFEVDFDCEIDVIENKIIVKDTIGEDKTSGAHFIEIVSNINSPNEDTITKFLAKDNGEEIVTSVIGKDGTGYSQATKNTDTYGFLEASEYFNDGDLANQVTDWINEKSESHFKFDTEIMPTQIDFRDINIGDLIRLRVERDSEILDVEASFKVIYEEVFFENGVAKYNIKLSEKALQLFNTQNYLSRIASRLKRQELK